MDLNRITYFRTVVELGTISKAAAFLRITQPALGRQIQSLERTLGVRLLTRSSKGVLPTPAGSLLMERTASMEADLSAMFREVAGLSDAVAGELHVAVQPPFSTMLMPDLVRRYSGEHPRVALEVLDGFSADVTDGLLEGRFDLAVTDTPSHVSRELTIIPLWVEPLALIGPASAAGSALFQARPVPLSEVVKYPLILPSARYTVRKLIDAILMREQLSCLPVVEANGPAIIYAMMKSGLGYSLMPAFGSAAVGGARICSAEIFPSIDRPVSIVVRTAILGERKVQTFLRLFKIAVAELAALDRFGPVRLAFRSAESGRATASSSPALLSLVGSRVSV